MEHLEELENIQDDKNAKLQKFTEKRIQNQQKLKAIRNVMTGAKIFNKTIKEVTIKTDDLGE